ncbi:MAG: FHA domain-containing protein, partial [Thermoleophilia bacterium]
LIAYAQREGWTMVGAPRITLARDDELSVGEFGIATRMVDSEEQAVAPAPAPAAAAAPPAGLPAIGLPAVGVPSVGVAAAPAGMAQTVVFPLPPAPPAVADQRVEPRLRSFLRGVDGTFELSDHVMVIGRSRRCDIVLADPNVSRQHAEVRSEGDHYIITDLDSTNGIKVNRRAVKRAVLGDGDRVELGSTELRFERRS